MEFKNFQLPNRKKTTVALESESKREFTDLGPHGLLYFQQCTKGSYKVSGKVAKIIIESCNECTFDLDAAELMTGTLTVIKTTESKISTKHIIPTIIVESSSECSFEVPEGWGTAKGKGALYVTLCEGISVISGGRTFAVVTPKEDVKKEEPSQESSESKEEKEEEDQGISQFISRFLKDEFVTEKIIREGGGYATTKREKKLADEKEERSFKILDEILAKSIKSAHNPLTPPVPKAPLPFVNQITERRTGIAKPVGTSAPPISPRTVNKNLLGEISQFSKKDLKTTETHVSTLPVYSGVPRHGHSTEDEIKEIFDEEWEVEPKIKALAEKIRKASRVVVYTGAGISTSAKIPDYRGPQGVWTLRDRGLQAKSIVLNQALPTTTHMALVALEKKKLIRFVVSTNTDGLHRRSGLPPESLSELHGNSYLEICDKCGKEYLRHFDVTRPAPGHSTGRTCEMNGCDGPLRDSIINFGENLPEVPLENAINEAAAADLALVLGTSLRVTPACNLPTYALKNKGEMVIVNLQKTPMDGKASLLIHRRTDLVMTRLCAELGVEIPSYDASQDFIQCK